MKYKEIVNLRQILIQQFSNSSLENQKTKTSISDVIKGVTGVNVFITIYSFDLNKFVFHHQIAENIGYTNEEFTIEAINNAENSNIHIIYEDDIEHKKRYDLVMYQLLAAGLKISSLADNYEISLRILDKKKNLKKVRRQSYIFETDKNGVPISQLDIWKIIPNEDPYVKVGLYYCSSEVNVISLFYKKNRELLNCDVTKRQIEILKLRNQRLDNKSIASQLNISLKTVENHIRNLKRKMQDFQIEKGIKEPIHNMNDMLHFVRKFGLFSFVVS